MKQILSLVFLSLLTLASAFAADVTGAWNFSAQTPNGDQLTAVWKLKSEGAQVTGTIEADFPGKVTIDEGSLEGDNIKLKITVKNEDGASQVYTANGTVSGSEMKGVVEGEIDGQKIKLAWTAKKS
jgi:opacity protein-like surface antigen